MGWPACLGILRLGYVPTGLGVNSGVAADCPALPCPGPAAPDLEVPSLSQFCLFSDQKCFPQALLQPGQSQRVSVSDAVPQHRVHHVPSPWRGCATTISTV